MFGFTRSVNIEGATYPPLGAGLVDPEIDLNLL